MRTKYEMIVCIHTYRERVRVVWKDGRGKSKKK